MGSSPTLKPATTFVFSRSPIVDKDGNATFAFLKILQQWNTQLQNGLTLLGQLKGEIDAATIITGRTEGIGTTVGHIDATGAALAPMVDFSRPYLNKTTDNITDGTGSPLAGGVVAHQALVASAPVVGQVLVFGGTTWDPSHPGFAGLSGTINPATQMPASGVTPGTYPLASVTVNAEGLVTGAAPGPTGISVTIVTAALTTGGTQGSQTFTNGRLTAQVQAT
jgi:hypothetical protein